MKYRKSLLNNKILLPLLVASSMVLISGCGSSSGSNSNMPTVNSSNITIDNAGVIPVFDTSSTTTVLYVHNNGKTTVSGISYVSDNNSVSIDGQKCNTLAAGQSCPIGITTPVLKGSNTQGSMTIKASYKQDGKNLTFSQIVNYAKVQNNTTDGAKFQSGVDISGYGNNIGYATIYLYGSGINNIYDVSSMTIDKPAVRIANGNITGHQIQSNFVQAVEVSAPILSSAISAKITVKSTLANTKLQRNLLGAGEFVNSADLGVEPVSSGAILTTGLVPLINTVNGTSSSMVVQNSGNQDAVLGNVSAGSGITVVSGCSGTTLAPAGTCTIDFNVTESGGSANITIPYSGGSASSIAGNVTWFNGVGAALVSMVATDNPVTFSATVGGSTVITVTNIGGYTLTNASVPTPVVLGGSATASISNNTCNESTLAVGASCSYQILIADSTTDLNEQINLGFSATYVGTNGVQTYNRVMPLGYNSTPYGAILSISPTDTELTISGNNYESTTQLLTVSNNGNLSANISSVLGSAPAYLSESLTTCGATLDAASSCEVTLQFGPTFSASNESGDSTYTVSYTAVGQSPSGSVVSNIAWFVQSYTQSISLTDHTALGATSGNGESVATQYNFTALGRDEVVSKSITLTYTNTGTNPMKLTGIQDSNSPYTWKMGGAGTTCVVGATLQPQDTCKIVYDNVFESNILALRSVGATYTENLVLPTLVYQDATNSNVQFNTQPNLPTGGNLIYAQSNQATLANTVTVNESGSFNESVTITHLLANADDSLYVTVYTKMEDYFSTVPVVGGVTGCSYSTADGIITQKCIMGKDDPLLSVSYAVNQSLLNDTSDLYLSTIFSSDGASQIVSMNQTYAVVNLGTAAGIAYVVDAGTVAGGLTQCEVNSATGMFSNCSLAVNGGFSRPRQVANYNNYLYVTSATGSVSTCSLSSFSILGCADSGSSLSYVNGIAIESSYAYITSFTGENFIATIQKCSINSADGSLSSCSSVKNFTDTDNLAGMTLNNGYLYVAASLDGGSSVGIEKCTIKQSDGSILGCNLFAPTDGNDDQIFNNPTSIAIQNGYAYVTNNSSSGMYSKSVIQCNVDAGTGNLSNCAVATAGFTNASGITTFKGFIYITDSATGLNTTTMCSISSVDGSLSGCTNSGGTNFTGPWGILIK